MFVIRLKDVDSFDRNNEIWRIDNHILIQKFCGVPSLRAPARQFQSTNKMAGYDTRAIWRFFIIDSEHVEVDKYGSEITIHKFPSISVLRDAKKVAEVKDEEFVSFEIYVITWNQYNTFRNLLREVNWKKSKVSLKRRESQKRQKSRKKELKGNKRNLERESSGAHLKFRALTVATKKTMKMFVEVSSTDCLMRWKMKIITRKTVFIRARKKMNWVSAMKMTLGAS